MTTQRRPAYYWERSRHFLALVDDLLNRGELELSCELVWGAVAYAVKALAAQRQWPHGGHSLLEAAVVRLVNEGAPPHLVGQYYMAAAFHRGFYGDRIFTPTQINDAKQPVADFIGALERLG